MTADRFRLYGVELQRLQLNGITTMRQKTGRSPVAETRGLDLAADSAESVRPALPRYRGNVRIPPQGRRMIASQKAPHYAPDADEQTGGRS